jgi:hypothetical protein
MHRIINNLEMIIYFDIKLEAVSLDTFLFYYYKKEKRKLIESFKFL